MTHNTLSLISNTEAEYVDAALAAVRDHLGSLPLDVQRKVKLAISVRETHGSATTEEMERELGANWVLARRCPRVVARYGKNVICISSKQYRQAERRAIEQRYP